jgi:predicted nuclease with TOPRIM domain
VSALFRTKCVQCVCLLCVQVTTCFVQCIVPLARAGYSLHALVSFFSVSSSLRFTFARLHVCVTEAEKQELLNETQGLMGQITESMKEVTTLQGRYDEVKHARDTLQESVDVLKSHNNQLIDDLKTADRTQEELREFSDRQAAQHRESVERLEMLLRESKKSASQTVVEMSQNLKVRPVSGRILIAVYCAAFTSVVLVYKTAVLTR